MITIQKSSKHGFFTNASSFFKILYLTKRKQRLLLFNCRWFFEYLHSVLIENTRSRKRAYFVDNSFWINAYLSILYTFINCF